MRVGRFLAGVVVVAVIGGCGAAAVTSDAPTAVPNAPEPPGTTAEQPDTTVLDSTTSTTIVVPEPVVATLPGDVQLERPAIWPAANVVFADPRDVAVDFWASPVAVGEFEPLGAGVGEIAIYAFDEGGVVVTERERSRLTVRQLAPTNGWYIVAARGGSATITNPPAGAVVIAGPVEVSGEASGHEANMTYLAALAGDWDVRYDAGHTQVGLYDHLPYRFTADLSAAPAGSTAFLMVESDSGVGQGGFSAVPVVVAGEIPATS